MKNNAFVLVFFLIFQMSTSQNALKVKLKSFHAAPLTDVILSQDEKYFYSADESGKILMFATENFDFIKSIRKGYGIPIEGMRLARNDSVLFASQRYEYSDRTTDSIIAIPLFNGKKPMVQHMSFNFLGQYSDSNLLTHSVVNGTSLIEVMDKNLGVLYAHRPERTVEQGAVSPGLNYLSYTESSFSLDVKLILRDIKNEQELLNIPIDESIKIVELFFDDEEQLYAICSLEDKDELAFYKVAKGMNFSKPVFTTSSYWSRFLDVKISKTENTYNFLMTSEGSFPADPLLISKTKNHFTVDRPRIENGAIKGLHINTKDSYIFFNPYYQNMHSVATFNVYSSPSETVISTYPKVAQQFYTGAFLPGGNWMIVGTKMDSDQPLNAYRNKIKYFENGTFNDRFGRLDYANYLEFEHAVIDYMSSDFKFDKRTGIHPFSGYAIGDENDFAYFTYDLIHDEVTRIADDQQRYTAILDYNQAQNLLLISPQEYYNKGHTAAQEFALIENNQLRVLKGSFKFGMFSVSGDYLLTIDANNKAEVRTTKKLNVVFEEQLVDGSYKLFNLDDNAFAISNQFDTIDFESCFKTSTLINFDAEDDTFSSSSLDCIFMTDLAYTEDKLAMIIDGFGIGLNDSHLQFLPSEFPKSISFSEDGTKLMVSFSNGKIAIYDSDTLKELGLMLHPDDKSHVFIDQEGNYFTNVAPEEYLVATENEIPIAFDERATAFYNPEKILSLFGNPNANYVEVLRKAIALKNEKTESSRFDQSVQNSTDLNEADPNLYVLSIGVSDYKQSDFNLTFADKDAMDIARIYGILEPEALQAYNTKFHGNLYRLFDPTKRSNLQLNKYKEQYAHIWNLQALSTDGTLWLEHSNEGYSVWDFNAQRSTPIEMPSDFSSDSYSFEKVLFVNPDNSGFYIQTESNGLYSYRFSSNNFTKVSLPFPDFSSETMAPMGAEKWVRMETDYVVVGDKDYNEATLTVGQENSKNTDHVIRFNLDIYTYLDAHKKQQIDTNYISSPLFQAISTDGKHLLYSSFAFDKAVFYKDLSDPESLPTRIDLQEEIGYGVDLSIAKDGASFAVVTRYGEDFKYHVNSYSFSGALLNTLRLKDDDELSLKGFSCINAQPYWIKEFEPLVPEEFIGANQLLAESNPHSFKKSYVKHLTNAQANSQAIKKELESFLKLAKSNDQVIVFLAGHGVLDQELNYYFAPYDMDFNHVTANGVSLSFIIEQLKACQSGNKLLLMDSCHSGNTLDMEKSEVVVVTASNDPNKRGSQAQSLNPRSQFKVSDVVSTLFDDFLSTSGVTIISASSGQDVAYENRALGNGAFTSAYIHLLKNELGDGFFIIDAADLEKSIDLTDEHMSSLLKEVMISTNGKQIPDLREVNKNSNLKLW